MNRSLWWAFGCFALVVAYFVAIQLIDVSDPALQARLQTAGVLASVASAVLAVAGLRQQRRTAPYQLPVVSLDRPGAQGEHLDERDSLEDFVRLMRARLRELGTEPPGFVPLTTAADDPRRDVLAPRLLAETGGDEELFRAPPPQEIDLLTIHDDDQFRRAVLLGEPGSGKSTCLRQLAVTQLDRISSFLEDDTVPAEDSPLLPVFIPLSEWQAKELQALDFLRQQVELLVGAASYYSRNFDIALRRGRFLLLLDGLNELPGRTASPREGRHDRKARDSSLSSLPEPHAISRPMVPRERSLRKLVEVAGAESRFVLSCRSHEYFDSLQWRRIRVLPMTPQQIDAFLAAYLEPEVAREFRVLLDQNRDLAEIATNPFFLSMVVYLPVRQLRPATSRGQVLRFLYPTLLAREHKRREEVGTPRKRRSSGSWAVSRSGCCAPGAWATRRPCRGSGRGN